MSIPQIFLDANVFSAATKSPYGGSGFVLSLAKYKKIKIITVKQALLEAEQNILRKLSQEYLNIYYQLLLSSSPNVQLITEVNFKEVMVLSELLPVKDIPIFLGVIYSKSMFLITLDRKHFLSNEKLKEIFPEVQILNPGEFLKHYLK